MMYHKVAIILFYLWNFSPDFPMTSCTTSPPIVKHIPRAFTKVAFAGVRINILPIHCSIRGIKKYKVKSQNSISLALQILLIKTDSCM